MKNFRSTCCHAPVKSSAAILAKEKVWTGNMWARRFELPKKWGVCDECRKLTEPYV